MSIARLFSTTIISCMILSGCASLDRPRDTLFQVSTINALMAGVYDGEATVAEVSRHGDFGIGTFDALDGEMVVLDGVTYQITADGVAHPVPPSSRTPFCAVTFFESSLSIPVKGTMSYAALQEYVNDRVPTKNVFYAVRIEGSFDSIKVRSVPRQERPYPPLTEVVKGQPVFTLTDVTGTLVGFVCPDYVTGINVAGWHLHFITEDKTAGGHLLDLSAHDLTVQIDETPSVSVWLPTSADFYGIDLSGDKKNEVERVEK